MAKIRRVDFSPDEWIAGTRELSLEERGAYWDVCALLYSRGGPIADDDAWISKALGCHVRTWRSIKARLIAVGKLSVDEQGHLINGRAQREIKKAEGRLKQARDAAEDSVKARQERFENSTLSNDYNEIPEASASDFGRAIHQPSTNNHHKTPVPDKNNPSLEEESSSASARAEVSDRDVDEAFKLFSDVAYDLHIRDAGFLNGPRRKLLAACLAECGTERWRLAMANLRTAGWLRDDRDPTKPKAWVNLANLLKPENFMGLLEERYAECHRADQPSRVDSESPESAGIAAAFARRSFSSG